MTDVRWSQSLIDVLLDETSVRPVRWSQAVVDVLQDLDTSNFVAWSQATVDVLRDVSPTTGAVIIILDGVDVSNTSGILRDTLKIRDVLNEEPDTCSFTTRNSAFSLHKRVVIALDVDTTSTRIFAGTIRSVRQVQDRFAAGKRLYEIECEDDTVLLDRHFLTGEFAEQSASTMITALMSAATSGFTTANVVAGLPVVSGGYKAVNKKVSEALTDICRQVGAQWKVDYADDLHVFITESTGDLPAALILGNNDFTDLEIQRDGTQIRNRVIVEGQRTTLSADLGVGATVVQVDDSTILPVNGGTVRIGTQIVTYGTATGPVVPSDSVLPVTGGYGVNFLAGAGSIPAGFWMFMVTALQGASESPINSIITATATVSGSDGLSVFWIDPDRASGRTYKIYMANGTSANPFNRPRFSGDPFPTAGMGDATTFQYFLNGSDVPETGDQFRYNILAANGTDVSTQFSTGMGTVSGVTAFQPKGTEVVIRATADDTGAQTALAAFEAAGTYAGIREHVIDDDSLTADAALLRANQELTDFASANGLVSISYSTRDLNARSGRVVSMNLASPIGITSSFLIQDVEISGFDQTGTTGASSKAYPIRRVNAAPVKLTSVHDIFVTKEAAR